MNLKEKEDSTDLQRSVIHVGVIMANDIIAYSLSYGNNVYVHAHSTS